MIRTYSEHEIHVFKDDYTMRYRVVEIEGHKHVASFMTACETPITKRMLPDDLRTLDEQIMKYYHEYILKGDN